MSIISRSSRQSATLTHTGQRTSIDTTCTPCDRVSLGSPTEPTFVRFIAPLECAMSPGSTTQRIVSWCLLALVGILQVPVDAGSSRVRGTKDLRVPFPCQGRACGCRSAEQCYSSCCCFSAAERQQFASEHGVDATIFGLTTSSDRISEEVGSGDDGTQTLVSMDAKTCCRVRPDRKPLAPVLPFEPTSFEPTSFEPTPFESASFEPASLESASLESTDCCEFVRQVPSSEATPCNRDRECSTSVGRCAKTSVTPKTPVSFMPVAWSKLPSWSAYLICRGITPAWTLFSAMTFFDTAELSLAAPPRGEFLPLLDILGVPLHCDPETPPPRFR
jgi:hypothetical protein